MILSQQFRDMARENALRFFQEKSSDDVKEVLHNAAFYGSSVTYGHAEKNAFFVDFSNLGARYEDQNLYLYTGPGHVMKLDDQDGWEASFHEFIDIPELKRLSEGGGYIRHIEIKCMVSK